MSVAKIEEYLNTRFAGHDIPALMQLFDAAVSEKVQEKVAAQGHDIRGQLQELRAEVQDCRDAVAHQSKSAAKDGATQDERVASHASKVHQQQHGSKQPTKAKGD